MSANAKDVDGLLEKAAGKSRSGPNGIDADGRNKENKRSKKDEKTSTVLPQYSRFQTIRQDT